MSDQSWIATFTGRKFWPLNPRIEDLDIVDIAHALSNMCRFTGHCRSFYSVAQHSVIASWHAPAWLKLSMLLHDASEAYMCDLSRPVKYAPGLEGYRTAEHRLQNLIGQRYDVSFDDPLVKQIDDRMLMTERRDLTTFSHEWSSKHLPPFTQTILPWSPTEAEDAFLRWARLLIPVALR